MIVEESGHHAVGAWLGHLRRARPMTIRAAAAAAGIGPATITRIEQGHVRPRDATVETLLSLYGIHDHDQRQHVLQLLHDRPAGWYDEPGIPLRLAPSLLLEAQASLIWAYCPIYLTPLLQTLAYAANVREPLEHIRGSQARLAPEGALVLWALIEQQALLDLPLTQSAERLEQIDALLSVVQYPHVTIQIVQPRARTGYALDAPRFTLLRFPESSRPDVLLQHLLTGPALCDEPRVVEEHYIAFHRHVLRAYTPQQTVSILGKIRARIAAENSHAASAP